MGCRASHLPTPPLPSAGATTVLGTRLSVGLWLFFSVGQSPWIVLQGDSRYLGRGSTGRLTERRGVSGLCLDWLLHGELRVWQTLHLRQAKHD